ncbi:MAG: phage tail assembly chaperone [Blastomonas sp.]
MTAQSWADGAGRLAGIAGLMLGWRPDEFWRATPAELAAILMAAAGNPDGSLSGPDRATIDRLMEIFPDG